jgi:hypothetical protein
MVLIPEYIDGWIAIRPHLPEAILQMPLLLRLFCYFLVQILGTTGFIGSYIRSMYGESISGAIRLLLYVLARRLSGNDPARGYN